jgi:hypothetical protein
MMPRSSILSASEREPVVSNSIRRRDVLAGMSEQQTRAYLIARDVVRRVRRSAPLFDGMPRRRSEGH